MRVVHHFTAIEATGGGAPGAVLDLVRLLAAAGEPQILLTAAGSELPRGWSDSPPAGVEVAPTEALAGRLELLSREGLARAASVLRGADVLHLHGLWRPRNAQIAGLARRAGLPYVVSPHGMLNPWALRHRRLRKAVYYRLFERRNLAGAAAVHCTAERERDRARRRVPHRRLTVIPLAIDLARFAEAPDPRLLAEHRPELAGEGPLVLALGRLHPVKGLELAIEAVAELARAGVACRLVLAGEGESGYVGRLRRLAERRGIADRVRFPGHVSGEEKLALYRRADVLVLPTRGENFGLVLFEALACGTPVLTTRGADTWQEIERGGGGRIFERRRAALAAALGELLADPDLRAEMGRAGREWVLDHLEPGSLVERYRQMYADAVASRHR